MPNFGYETKGDYLRTIENYIAGSVFTITEAGTADSITIGLSCSAPGDEWTGKVKCAIYNHATLAFVGSTEERTINVVSTPIWFTFNFTGTKPSFAANTDYILGGWAESLAGRCYLHYNVGDTNQGHYKSLTYNGFPNPLVPTHENYKYSIYCTYTAGGGGVTVKKGSNLANTMTTMLNSKMLFSACNRFPKLSPRHF